MNSMRSFANKPRLDKQEKPKRANEKKKMPARIEISDTKTITGLDTMTYLSDSGSQRYHS